MNKEGFFYVIKTADTPINVYKVGKTTATNPNKRLCAYPRYSACVYTIAVKNVDIFEKIVIHKLKGCAKRCMEFGNEYYEADPVDLINAIHNIWIEYGNTDTDLYKSIKKNQPLGWQYFANEWLIYNKPQSIEIAYINYLKLIIEHFKQIPCKYDKFLAYYLSVIY